MNIYDYNFPVAKRISQIMEDRGLKQCAVAKQAGYSNQQFNDMINGRRIIKVSDLPLIAKALNVTPNDLYFADNQTDSKAS